MIASINWLFVCDSCFLLVGCCFDTIIVNTIIGITKYILTDGRE